MKKLGKILGTVLLWAIPAGLLIWVIIWAMRTWNKIDLGKPYIKKIDLKGKSISDLVNALESLSGQGEQNLDIITIGYDIKNKNNKSIPLTNVRIKLYYEGEEIASTSDQLAAQKIDIKANDTTNITDTPTIYLDKNSGSMIAAGLLGKKPEIGYKISMSIYGIPLPLMGLPPSMSGKFKWE